MVCVAQAQGVFSFFNKPGQKGQQGQQGARRTPQANSSHAKEEEARAVNEDWGNQQVHWTWVALHQPVCGIMTITLQCKVHMHHAMPNFLQSTQVLSYLTRSWTIYFQPDGACE